MATITAFVRVDVRDDPKTLVLDNGEEEEDHDNEEDDE